MRRPDTSVPPVVLTVCGSSLATMSSLAYLTTTIDQLTTPTVLTVVPPWTYLAVTALSTILLVHGAITHHFTTPDDRVLNT